MAGNHTGGKKCANTTKAKYGKDWYAKIGAMGGRKGHTGGFASNPELARAAGRIGGLRSKRNQTVVSPEEEELKKKYYYFKTRLKHFQDKIVKAEDMRVVSECEDAIDYYTKQLRKITAELKKIKK